MKTAILLLFLALPASAQVVRENGGGGVNGQAITPASVAATTVTAHAMYALSQFTTPRATFTYVQASSITTTAGASLVGNVGLNVAADASYPIKMKATTDVNLRVTHDGAGNLRMGAGTDASTWDANMEIRNAKTNFATGNVLVDTGNLGVGTTGAPASKLHLSSGTIRIDGTGAPTTGGALCLNAGGAMSKCTSAVDVSGNCTCP